MNVAGVRPPAAGAAELLIAREWAILAGENDYTTGTFQQITGRPPRPVAEFLHEHRAEFLRCPRVTLPRSRSAAFSAAPASGSHPSCNPEK